MTEKDTQHFLSMMEHPTVGNLHSAVNVVLNFDGFVQAWTNAFDLKEILTDLPDRVENLATAVHQDDANKLGGLMGDWTALQACFRKLAPGEVRIILCNKVIRGIQRRQRYSVSPAVNEYITSMTEATKS